MLNSILGECVTTGGSIVKKGTLAYVPQEAWTFSATLRQNILFGKAYNQHTYQTTIEACALEKVRPFR